MTFQLTRQVAVRAAWVATGAALFGLCLNLILVATGQSVGEEALLLPCAVLISSFQITRKNVNPRQDVISTIVSGLLLAGGLIFLGMRVVG